MDSQVLTSSDPLQTNGTNVLLLKYRLTWVPGDTDYWGKDSGYFDETIIHMPKGSEYSSCLLQIDSVRYGFIPQISIYFLTPENNKDDRSDTHVFRVVATGQPIILKENEKFLKTISVNKGEKVYHIFHQHLTL